jgi:hypothetical protein
MTTKTLIISLSAFTLLIGGAALGMLTYTQNQIKERNAEKQTQSQVANSTVNSTSNPNQKENNKKSEIDNKQPNKSNNNAVPVKSEKEVDLTEQKKSTSTKLINEINTEKSLKLNTDDFIDKEINVNAKG